MPAPSRWVIPLAVLTALVVGCDSPKPPKTVETRKTLNKTTRDVRDIEPELKKGAVVLERAPGDNVYVYATAQAAILTVKNNLNQLNAINDSWPKDAKALVDEVLTPNDISLPMLPYYLEYGYDAKGHNLVILNYPELKKQREKERD